MIVFIREKAVGARQAKLASFLLNLIPFSIVLWGERLSQVLLGNGPALGP